MVSIIPDEKCSCGEPGPSSILGGSFSYYDFLSIFEGTEIEHINLGDLCFCKRCSKCAQMDYCDTCEGDLSALRYVFELQCQ